MAEKNSVFAGNSLGGLLSGTGPAGLPVIALFAAVIYFWAAGPDVSFSAPNLNLFLYAIFSLLMPLSVVFLISRSFLKTGEPGLILLGCGVLIWCISGVSSLILPKVDPDTTFTIYNTSLLIASLFHFSGALTLFLPTVRMRWTGTWLVVAYLICLTCFGLLVFAAYENLTPQFFIPGRGGTLLRQIVLASAFVFFVLSAVVLKTRSRNSTFNNWYALALLLISVGALGFLVQSTLDSLVTWTSRTALFLSGVYMLMAANESVRETRVWEVALNGELAESRKRFREMLDMVPEGVLVQELVSESDRGNFVQANQAICSMLGYTQEEIYKLNTHDILLPESSRSAIQELLPIKEYNVLQHSEILVTRDGRHIPAEIKTHIYEDRGRPMVMSVIQDMSERNRIDAERRKAEQDLREANERLKEYASKLEEANTELESFTYSVSHDLRSPLRAIEGFSKILSEEIGRELDPESLRKFDIIRNNTQKMSQLIDDLLKLSRTGRAEMSILKVDIEALVHEIWDELRAGNPERDMVLKVESLPAAKGDRALLKQVFSNLLGNAVKFTGRREKSVIEVSGSASEGMSTYCIRDNGAGFDMRYSNKLFGVFNRLHSETEFAGTGVGLAIVKKIIHKHGGAIWAESKPDEGAAFYFTLPG